MASSSSAGPERLFTLRQLNEAGYPTRLTMYKKIRSGQVPAVRFGDSYRIRESDLPLIADPITLDFKMVAERLLAALPQSNEDQRRDIARQLLTHAGSGQSNHG